MIKQPPINWVKYLFINIATYSICVYIYIYTHILPAIQILLPIIFLPLLAIMFYN